MNAHRLAAAAIGLAVCFAPACSTVTPVPRDDSSAPPRTTTTTVVATTTSAMPLPGTAFTTPTGTFTIGGAVLDKYLAAGGPGGRLGNPVTNEQTAVGNGRYANFERGSIYWSPDTPACVVEGDVGTAWLGRFGPEGPLGYPLTDQFPVPGGFRANYQFGYIEFANNRVIVDR